VQLESHHVILEILPNQKRDFCRLLPVRGRVFAVQDRVGTWPPDCRGRALLMMASQQVSVMQVRVGDGSEMMGC
jgi:hypothetical protein